ncbi:MAG: uL30 family ribosomal protein [archaeon]
MAVIRIRGNIGVRTDVSDTMKMLHLYHANSCLVLKSTASAMGMVKKAKDYITYGEISDNVLAELSKKISRDTKAGKVFGLAPPRGGFERKGIKTPFANGGAIGYRGEKINDLIKKMI